MLITGLRPGEKLHEELSSPEESVEATTVERVFLVLPPDTVPEVSGPLRHALDLEDGRVILEWLYETFPLLTAPDRSHLEEAAGTPSQ